MKPVGLTDYAFLLLERRNQPMHVGGLMLVTPPKKKSGDFILKMVEQARTAAQAEAPFNQRLVKRMGAWFWDEDREFDIESHFYHLSLPQPGRIRELLALVSKLHGNLLDRTKPLWEFYLIDGLEDGRVAAYAKIHHALVDGVAAMRLLQRAMSENPKDNKIEPLWAIPKSIPSSRSSGDTGKKTGPYAALAATIGAARQQIGALHKVAYEVLRSIRASRTDPDYVSVYQAPPTILNQRISASRRFAAQSFSLKRIKAVAKQQDVTLNDVVLAMCASALRKYLGDLNALPDQPLVAMVPVSLRRDDSEAGNQIAMVLANLATHLEVPQERLDAIVRSMKNSKERFSRMSQLEILNYMGVTMAVSNFAMTTGLKPQWQAFNIVISNVPGPKKTLYWNGARLDGTYPVSIVLDGQALNITLNSYADNMEVGLIACRRTLPHMQRLLQYLEEGLVELEALSKTG